MIELTEEQKQAVRQGEALRLAVPDLGELEDKRLQQSVLAYSMKQAAKIAQENPY